MYTNVVQYVCNMAVGQGPSGCRCGSILSPISRFVATSLNKPSVGGPSSMLVWIGYLETISVENFEQYGTIRTGPFLTILQYLWDEWDEV